MVKTKIICTIGPASETATVLRQMMLEGMDVIRLNFSHGSHVFHARRIRIMRQLNRRYRRHVRILQDLEGYRIRVGYFRDKKEIELKRKQTILLTNEKMLGYGNTVPFDYAGDLRDIKTGSHIYIDDGNICLLVNGRAKQFLKTEVVIPGIVKERKGINIPEAKLSFRGLTQKDVDDIALGIKCEVDYIAQSFIRNRKDVCMVKDMVKKKLPSCQVIAKIENRQGIKDIDEIIDAADGIMIARGDMGVSLPLYEIPFIQKQIINKCNCAGKFVITATQMLESMVENVRPTRAEVTDVANAILDGSDFLMLSAETAIGKHPVQAVRMMNQIIRFTEEKKILLRAMPTCAK
jgi:pyruvate kinase